MLTLGRTYGYLHLLEIMEMSDMLICVLGRGIPPSLIR